MLPVGCTGKKNPPSAHQEHDAKKNPLFGGLGDFFWNEKDDIFQTSGQGQDQKQLIALKIGVFPLAGQGNRPPFWQTSLEDEMITLLQPPEDLLGGAGGSSSTSDPPSETPRSQDSSRGVYHKPKLDEVPHEIAGTYPVELSLSIKKIEFFSDESGLLSSESPTGFDDPFHLPVRLDLTMARELEQIFKLADHGLFDELVHRTFDNPERLLAAIEKTVVDLKQNLTSKPTLRRKAQEYLAKNLENLLEVAQRETSTTEENSMDYHRSKESLSQSSLNPGTFGPFRWKFRISPQGTSLGEGAGRTREMSQQSWLEDGQGRKVSELMLPRGIYRGVRIHWGGLAQVKGCVHSQGQLSCTTSALSPINKTSLLKELPRGVPEGTDLPLVNESPDWPLVEDFVEDYPLALDLQAQGQMNLVYSLPHLLSFYRPDVPSLDLSRFMPRQRPYFYLSGHRSRMALSLKHPGRLYEFVGHVSLCPLSMTNPCRESEGGKQLPEKERASSLQILVDQQSQVERLFWHGPFGSFQGDIRGVELMSGGRRKQDSYGGAIASPGESEGAELVEITLTSWMEADQRGLHDGPSKIKLMGFPLVLNSWLRGQMKNLEIRSEDRFLSAGPRTSPGLGDGQRGFEAQEPLGARLSLKLTRVL